jgi:iron complex outermembrane receptor protein
VFAVAKKTIGLLNLSGGLRYDVRRISADALFLDANEQPTAGSALGPKPSFRASRAPFATTAAAWARRTTRTSASA